jgi:hypothetical protein
MRTVLSVPAVLALASLTTPAVAQVRLDGPTSVLWHDKLGGWLVSNVSGPPTAKDGRGWLTFIPARDRKVPPIWMDGFDAPKGMAVVGDRLYVADIDTVVVVDVANRSVEKRYPVPGARSLRGVAAGPGGDLYVTDTLTDTIYKLPAGGAPEKFLKSAALEGPTALVVDGAELAVAAWGKIRDASTLATSTPGRILRVDLQSRRVRPLGSGERLGQLDGLANAGYAYIVADRGRGRLLSVSPAGTVTVIREGFKGCAGLAVNAASRVIAVPEADGPNVVFLPLK